MDYYQIVSHFYTLLMNSGVGEACQFVEQYIATLPQEAIGVEVLNLVKMLNGIAGLKNDSELLMQTNGFKVAYDYLNSKYAGVISDCKAEPFVENRGGEIWWCWLQGIENAPEIIKACYISVQNLGVKVNLITFDNYGEYVSLPEYVVDKYKAGKISMAHFSDMLRLELLTTYGGTWIDSTVYVSDRKMYDVISAQDVFLYKNILRGTESGYIEANNWLISATKPSGILSATKALLYEFWKQEDEAIHYYLFHLFMTMAIRLYPEEWEQVPTYSDIPCHVLQMELDAPYTEARWQQIMNMTSLHKLSYKTELADVCGTMYQYIINR